MMRRRDLVILLLAAIIPFMGCDCCSKPDETPPAVPSGVTSITGDGSVTLYWHPNSEADFEGYRIYRGFAPTGYYDLMGSSVSAYWVDQNVVNGETYFYAVSAYDRNGNESELSYDIVHDTPRPEGRGVVLWDYLEFPNDAGFNFSEEMVQAWDERSTDIYYEFDPNLEASFMNCRDDDTDIQDFGYIDSLDDIDWAPENGWSGLGWVELIVGHGYIVWTRDNHFAKFRVTQVGGECVKFDWAYQVDPGNPELMKGGN